MPGRSFVASLLRRIENSADALGLALRIGHAKLFELGLLLLLGPFIAWWLGISLWQAALLDLAFSGFYMVYALAFNLAYDRLFPLSEWQQAR